MTLQPETRLLLSALLLVLAERDEKFVKIKHRHAARDARSKRHISEGANLFVASLEFETMCEAVGIEPERLRIKSPSDAYAAYKKVIADEDF